MLYNMYMHQQAETLVAQTKGHLRRMSKPQNRENLSPYTYRDRVKSKLLSGSDWFAHLACRTTLCLLVRGVPDVPKHCH